MSALPRVLGEDDLPPAELAAARLDGELFACGSGWVPPDVPGTAEDRAAAASLGLPSAWIADLDTAAWIWGARDDAPAPATFCVAREERGAKPRAGVLLREVPLPRGDRVRRGGRGVTTPTRTLIDLLRRARWGASDELTALRLLDVVDRGELPRIRSRLAGIPYGAVATDRLERISPR